MTSLPISGQAGGNPEGSGARWIPISAGQVRERRFRETPLGRRGYRPEDVDLFLGRLAGEIDRWATGCAESQIEIRRLRDYYRTRGADPDHTPQRQAPEDTIAVLARAHEYADRLVADAQNRAKAIRQDARAQADAIVARANHCRPAPATNGQATVRNIDADSGHTGPRHATAAPSAAAARRGWREAAR
jgi:DivIVA domain-containing protein